MIHDIQTCLLLLQIWYILNRLLSPKTRSPIWQPCAKRVALSVLRIPKTKKATRVKIKGRNEESHNQTNTQLENSRRQTSNRRDQNTPKVIIQFNNFIIPQAPYKSLPPSKHNNSDFVQIPKLFPTKGEPSSSCLLLRQEVARHKAPIFV